VPDVDSWRNQPLTPEEFTAYMSVFALYYVFIGLGVLVAAFMQVRHPELKKSNNPQSCLFILKRRPCAGSWRARDKFTDCGKYFSPKSCAKTSLGLTRISLAT